MALCSVALLPIVACGKALEAPPLNVEHRESLLGAGRILQISNFGEVSLNCAEVRIETPSGDVKNHGLGTLAAGELIELGWKKLGGFEIPFGAEVTFECEGFLLPLTVEIQNTGSQ